MLHSINAILTALALLFAPMAFAVDSGNSDPPPPRVDPDFAAGKQAVEKKDWARAIESLNKALARDAKNADTHNLLGYSYRNAGQLDRAFKHYEQALVINPRHRGAHEYVGEAYLQVNNVTKAEEHLAALRKLCSSCEELTDLQRKVAAYRKSNPAAK